MKARKHTDAEFLECWRRHESPAKVSKELGIALQAVYSRRTRLEAKYGLHLATRDVIATKRRGEKIEARRRVEEAAQRRFTSLEPEMHEQVTDGTVVVFSDAHYWPGPASIAHQALVTVCERLKPQLVVANGDVLDGATISRHPRLGWEQRPSVREEIDALCTRMREVERAAPGATLVRTLGNHDSRFENYISANAPALEGVHGTSLFDFLPHWRGGFALHVNHEQEGWTVIRHVHVAGGVHSAYNSTLRAGTHYVHGHLHKLQVVPYADYRGRRYGVDTGTLADPKGPQFAYVQGGPLNWCSGFAVLTFREGRLLLPELVEVIDGRAWFRGEQL